MKRKLIGAVIFFAQLLLALIMFFTPTHAAESLVPSLPSNIKCSLTVVFAVTQNGVKTDISGASFEIWKTADLKVVGGSPEFTLESEYKALNINFSKMTASESLTAAQYMAKAVRNNGISGYTTVTGNDGKCTFKNLTPGIYLVEETKRTGTAKKYKNIQPFILLIPELTGDGETKVWNTGVTAAVKTQISEDPSSKVKPHKGGGSQNGKETKHSEEELPTDPSGKNSGGSGNDENAGNGVNTGDSSNIKIYLIVVVCSSALMGIAVFSVIRKKRLLKDERKEE